jgi:hypothetical protein
MKRSTLIILVLAFALLASNGLWIYQSIDAAVTAGYREASWKDNHDALAQALAILPVVARSDSTREQVLDAAKQAANSGDSFEKDGFIWIGKIGLKFDRDGRLIDVSPAWEPF